MLCMRFAWVKCGSCVVLSCFVEYDVKKSHKPRVSIVQSCSAHSLKWQGSDKWAFTPALLIPLHHVVTHIHRTTLSRTAAAAAWNGQTHTHTLRAMPVVGARAKEARPYKCSLQIFDMYWTAVAQASHSQKDTLGAAVYPHYLLFAPCSFKSSPSVASVCMWQRIRGLIQSVQAFFLGGGVVGTGRGTKMEFKPSNLRGVKWDLNQSGRTWVGRKPQWGWIGIKPKLKYSIVYICLYCDVANVGIFLLQEVIFLAPAIRVYFPWRVLNRSKVWTMTT